MRNKLYTIIYIMLLCAVLTACNNESTTRRPFATTQPSTEDAKDVETLAVVTRIDEENKIIEFYKIDTEEECTYSYNSGTEILTKTGRSISMQSIVKGEVVDVYYDPASFMVSKVQISDNKEVWENGKVNVFSVDDTTRSITVGSSLYYYKDDIVVVSNEEIISISELTSEDQLIVKGYGNRIVSIIVDKGHGYLSLKGADIFVGGLIDVGGSIVKVIEENMLILVPEGSYKVEVRNNNTIAEKHVTIIRGEQSIVDFSDIAANVTTTGSLKLNINVSNAALYIDNIKRENIGVINLTTGTHSIIVTADGYETYSTSVEIETGHKSMDIILEKDNSEEATTGEEETTMEAPTIEDETIISEINDVTVSGPEGGLVYFDSTYMGIAPVTFDMITGTHVISIIRGTEINSYTVTLAEGGDDVIYDFTDK